MRRQIQDDSFLWSKQWRSVSKSILRRDGYMDQYILAKEGRAVPATVVHHIFPRSEYPQYALEPWNLISLSKYTHDHILHTVTGKLTNQGKRLMYETAFKNTIKLKEKILVIGLPGSGKTTYVKDNLGPDAIAYDMDAIAAAFRLTEAHSEIHKPASRMAAALFSAFAARALDYASRVYLIRAAPTPEEVAQIRPDEVVIAKGMFNISRRQDYEPYDAERMLKKIQDCKTFCERNGIPVIEIPAPKMS